MSDPYALQKNLYEEEQPTERWVMVVAWLAASCACLFILAAFFIPGIPILLRLLAAGVLGFVVVSVWNFRRLRIKATAEGITFGFGIFRWSVRWRDIIHVDAKPYIFLRFLGWGIRLDFRGTVGFIARTSMGVQLETRRLKYFISTNHPQALCDFAQRFIPAKRKVV